MSVDRHRHPSVRRKAQEALRARDALAAALTKAGIQLPAMDVRTPWNDELDEPPADAHEQNAPCHPAPYALIHLGVCSAPVAHDLAEVIERGAAARGAER
ncbi:hypothetical protein [Streptomyces sp. TS71-3]|uniref:hypothetical protein n=1 Tax=Streptomyces sp. TS71-3 TaxID=2733862 RepID=UPI001B0D5E73|nr:hypothetical protein [Streptomyces sp. TS71-3]GHJ36005.1 hypothetical protein Sm713_16140 [Streptomyces sp. TS71-3]